MWLNILYYKYTLSQRPWTSCSDAWHHGFNQYQQIQNQKLTASVRNLTLSHVWIFHQDYDPKQASKMCHWALNESFTKIDLWPEPYRKWPEAVEHLEGLLYFNDRLTFWMKDKKDKQCRFIYQGCQYYWTALYMIKSEPGFSQGLFSILSPMEFVWDVPQEQVDAWWTRTVSKCDLHHQDSVLSRFRVTLCAHAQFARL